MFKGAATSEHTALCSLTRTMSYYLDVLIKLCVFLDKTAS
uniref:Uncharacterized protein n=1 Tax=Anguilla anguilla TaxID=7936 RepID=A0A0E9Q1B9_ANGAN